MGSFAQCTADEYQLTRKDMDDYALASLSRAQDAIKSGYFATEIAPVTIKGRKGDTIVDTDEAPGRGMPDKIPTLKPAFAKDGTITAATRSSISDGAAAVVLDPPVDRRRQGLHPGRAHRRHRRPRAKAVRIHHRPDRRDPEIARQGRLVGRRRRPVRSQRGVRLRRHVRDEGPRHPARQDQHPRRRHRASATRSAPAARASSSPWSTRSRPRASSAASRRLCIGGGEATAVAVELV